MMTRDVISYFPL